MSAVSVGGQEANAPILSPLPQHWDVVPVKRQYEVRLGKMLQSSPSSPADELRPYLRAINIQPTGLEFEDVREMWFRPGEFKQLRLQNGDLVVSEGGDVGRSAIFRHHRVDVAIQNAINRVRPRKDASTTYLHYWLQAVKEAGYIEVLCNRSTIPHFTAEKLSELLMPLPPPGEQCRIAAFLDHETARIDELVREQERLISHLEAKRSATISHSIRGGLSTEVRSDTGNAWVGSIPASWRLTRLKFEARAVDCLHSTPTYLESGEYPAVRTADLSPGRLDLSNALRVSKEEYISRNTRLVPRQGDIIYSREGTFGIAAVVPEGAELCLGQRVMLLRPHKMDSQFLMWQLNADFVYQQALQDQIGATAARVNMETVANYVLVAPPKREQTAIAQFLDAALGEIDNGVTAARSLISLLNERRAALISAAVTGELDLRNWHLPEHEAVAEVA